MPTRAALASLGLPWGLAGLVAPVAVPAHALSMLAAVKARRQLLCGINGQLPGFSVQNARKECLGFEIDYCRAVAAAVLGDDSKVGFVRLIPAKRFDVVRDGSIDVLMRNATASLQRTARTGVRAGGEKWLDVACWAHFALLETEELSITQVTVDEQLRSPLPGVRRLLGVALGNGKARGLEEDWAYKAIKQVGNHGEIYERNVGKGSALKFARVNALWSRGGVMYPLPMQ
jgi:hypothetical protein